MNTIFDFISNKAVLAVGVLLTIALVISVKIYSPKIIQYFGQDRSGKTDKDSSQNLAIVAMCLVISFFALCLFILTVIVLHGK